MLQFPGVALVVGAATNDGRAVARALIEGGCSKLGLVDKDDDGLRAIEASCKAMVGSEVDILCVKGDAIVPEEIDAAIVAIVQKFECLNYCANCLRPQPGLRLDEASMSPDSEASIIEVRETTNAWQRGTWLSMRAEIRQFMKQAESTNKEASTNNASASIVNISAAQGIASEAGFPVYCAAAHAIVGASKATAMDYLGYDIRINCVCPGPQKADAGKRDLSGSKLLSMAPSGKDITSEEVARAVVFLLGDGASAITGVQLPVDGGWSLYHH